MTYGTTRTHDLHLNDGCAVMPPSAYWLHRDWQPGPSVLVAAQ